MSDLRGMKSLSQSRSPQWPWIDRLYLGLGGESPHCACRLSTWETSKQAWFALEMRSRDAGGPLSYARGLRCSRDFSLDCATARLAGLLVRCLAANGRRNTVCYCLTMWGQPLAGRLILLVDRSKLIVDRMC
jgi:hypothetical protein